MRQFRCLSASLLILVLMPTVSMGGGGVGACCLSSGTCLLADGPTCVALGGTFLGFGTVCVAGLCGGAPVCGDGIKEGAEVCDPPCERAQCAAGQTCAPDCDACIANDNDDDVRRYACRCYNRMGITPANIKTAVGGDKINCKEAGNGIIKQLYTTEKCPKSNRFTTVGQADCKVRDINILEGKCTGDATKKCLGDGDCNFGPCNTTSGKCTGDATKTCTEDAECKQGSCNNFAFKANPDAAGDFPPDCDRTAWLSDICYGNTYIHKWDIAAASPADSKVTVALLCRHRTIWSDDDAKFDDIAMIMQNNTSGETCWFQSPSGDNHRDLDGTMVPLPHTAAAPYDNTTKTGWFAPSDKAQVNCIYCHDNGPWMNSRWMFNSGIDLQDQKKPYHNKGFAFSIGYCKTHKNDTCVNNAGCAAGGGGDCVMPWKEPNFITADTAGLKNQGNHKYTNKSCTSCHKIHAGESGQTAANSSGAFPEGGNSLKKWIKYTVGSTIQDKEYPPNSNATGKSFPIAYWMSPIGKG